MLKRLFAAITGIVFEVGTIALVLGVYFFISWLFVR